MSEIHELPLAHRLVCEEIRDWLDLHTGLALAGAPNAEATAAIGEVRHLHLDGYAYTVVPAILSALKRAGLLRLTNAPPLPDEVDGWPIGGGTR